MPKYVAIMFGGVSSEHEVSVITGLQVLTEIDRRLYKPLMILSSKTGDFFYLPNIYDKSDFASAKRIKIVFGKDSKGGYVQTAGFLAKKFYIYSAFLTFHGGLGESGGIQGLLSALNIPYTSSDIESSVVAMNKRLSKEAVKQKGINVIEGYSVFSSDIKHDAEGVSKNLSNKLSLPLIVKPCHLGSSIGIGIANDIIQLEKSLIEASRIDKEILVEKYLEPKEEFNCAVRQVKNIVEVSEIERPISYNKLLSFADKYERPDGIKKGGMASLGRELPAKITREIASEIYNAATSIFFACQCKGTVRIDFIFSADKLFFNEVNPIPGSMAYYLWETSGYSFKQQITDLIEQSRYNFFVDNPLITDYETDILLKFTSKRH